MSKIIQLRCSRLGSNEMNLCEFALFGNGFTGCSYKFHCDYQLPQIGLPTPESAQQPATSGSAPFPTEAELVGTFPAFMPPNVDLKSFKFGVTLVYEFFKKWSTGHMSDCTKGCQ